MVVVRLSSTAETKKVSHAMIQRSVTLRRAEMRRVISENASRCIGCHTGCGVPPDGYEGTCTGVGGQSGGAFP